MRLTLDLSPARESSDLPPASHWQSLTTTGTLIEAAEAHAVGGREREAEGRVTCRAGGVMPERAESLRRRQDGIDRPGNSSFYGLSLITPPHWASSPGNKPMMRAATVLGMERGARPLLRWNTPPLPNTARRTMFNPPSG